MDKDKEYNKNNFIDDGITQIARNLKLYGIFQFPKKTSTIDVFVGVLSYKSKIN